MNYADSNFNPCLPLTHDGLWENENLTIEFKLLLEAVHLKYGYDFRSYVKSTLANRILRRAHLSKFSNLSEMTRRLLYDPQFFEVLLLDLFINVTEMFRDPPFFQNLRKHVVPSLQTYSSINVWIAGCATGEEAYSIAILLKEIGMEKKFQIYATDLNEEAIEIAKRGKIDSSKSELFETNYKKAGGLASLTDYFQQEGKEWKLDENLLSSILFTSHNLAHDAAFNEMHLILCRNVLIYFDDNLKQKAFELFHESLPPNGFLCLGTSESLFGSTIQKFFKEVQKGEKIFININPKETKYAV